MLVYLKDIPGSDTPAQLQWDEHGDLDDPCEFRRWDVELPAPSGKNGHRAICVIACDDGSEIATVISVVAGPADAPGHEVAEFEAVVRFLTKIDPEIVEEWLEDRTTKHEYDRYYDAAYRGLILIGPTGKIHGWADISNSYAR